MKTKPMYKKSSILSQKQREKMISDAASKANLLMTLTVLNDVFDFKEEELKKFVDSYEIIVKSCETEEGLDDWKKLAEEFKKQYGIKVV